MSRDIIGHIMIVRLFAFASYSTHHRAPIDSLEPTQRGPNDTPTDLQTRQILMRSAMSELNEPTRHPQLSLSDVRYRSGIRARLHCVREGIHEADERERKSLTQWQR